MKRFIVLLLIVMLCAACTSTPTIESHVIEETPPIDLITLEQRWAETWAGGRAPKSDEVKDGRKCWHVKDFDFHGQQTWQAWRCVIVEGPSIGTIQWEWRNPEKRN